MSDTAIHAPVLAADGTPLKRSLGRALRVQKMRALALIAPLLIFVLISFILPIGDMLFRSVENQIVEDTMPYTVEELKNWDGASDELPPEPVFRDMYFDLFLATEMKRHTRLGSRFNYESSGMSSLFRQAGRKLTDAGKAAQEALEKVDPVWGERETYFTLFNAPEGTAVDTDLIDTQKKRIRSLADEAPKGEMDFAPSEQASALLPLSARVYTSFAVITGMIKNKAVEKTKPMESLYLAMIQDVTRPGFSDDLKAYDGPFRDDLARLAAGGLTAPDYTAIFENVDRAWGNVETWRVIQTHSGAYTSGYFLNAIDMQKTPEGAKMQPQNKRVLIQLFIRTIIMSLTIMGACILLGYPVAWLLANVSTRTANLLLMLVLLLTDILPGPLRFPVFFIWATSVFTMAGVTFGNLNAMALQGMGRVAGMAASLISAASTLMAIAIAAPVGLLYSGTALPVVSATLICSAAAWLLMRGLRTGG